MAKEIRFHEVARSEVLKGVNLLADTVKLTVVDVGLLFPPASVATAETVCPPFDSAPVVNDQLPAPSAIVVPIDPASMNTSIDAFASAVPVIVGVAVITVSPSVGDVITGAAGGVVSTVKFTAVDNGPVLPTPSVA